MDKINSLYQIDVNKTVNAVEKLTGVKIDHYIVIKNSALIDLVDAIGGVHFNVPIDMKYDDETQDLHIDLKAGMQLIDGDKAEQLLRFRHSNPDKNGKMTTYPAEYGLDDFGRMRTQREFIQATATQLASWKNITKLKDITTAIFSNLDTDMKLTQMIGYIPSALKLNTEELKMEQLPGKSDIINELWFYKAYKTETAILVTQLMNSLGLTEEEYNEKYTPIEKVTLPEESNEQTNTTTTNVTNTTNTLKTN